MGGIAIRVEALSKRYRIGARQAAYRTFREALVDAARSPFRWVRSLMNGSGKGSDEETIWALRDVSFEIERGQAVGIIGRNGAGKTTLLKILSRVTEPTEGAADIHGRVGSLLEVGTGFHPELTGRENIALSGAILGMRRREVQRKFDEIVAFAEVDRFIDTPVKHYSSGMYLRLAFAVAAHLEPEILLVDEVLAVGDARFQKKCLGKMEEVGQQGRTVLFVSHNMPAVMRLCTRAILLADGRLVADGEPAGIVGHYLSSGNYTPAESQWADLRHAPGDEVVRLRRVRVTDAQGVSRVLMDVGDPINIEIEFVCLESSTSFVPLIKVFNDDGTCVFTSAGNHDPTFEDVGRKTGTYRSRCEIPAELLSEGTFYVYVAVLSPSPKRHHLRQRDVVSFQVADRVDGNSVRGDFGGLWRGVVRPRLRWTTEFREEMEWR